MKESSATSQPATSPAPAATPPGQRREREETGHAGATEAIAHGESDKSRGRNTKSKLAKWYQFNERFAEARGKATLRWAIIVFIVLLSITIFGFIADYQANLNLFPCWLKPEKKIDEPYGVVVGNVADQSLEDLSSDEEDAIEKINQAMFDQLGELKVAGKVGVGQTCDRDVQSAAGRQEYMSDVREKLSGQLAVSLLLSHEGSRINVEVELSIGSRERLDEGQELAGYYKIFGGTITGPLKIENSVGTSTVSELLNPYLALLRAIANYSGAEYQSAIADLNGVLTNPHSRDDLKKLAFVLEGNAEGRLGGTESLNRAEAAFYNARSIDESYPRASLGLGEIKYQKALAATKGNGKAGRPCGGEITPEARRLLDDALRLYSEVAINSNASSVPDADVRASYGTGRVRACLLLFGDSSQAEAALHDLQSVIRRFESDRKRTWLQSPASGAYGETGLVYCKLRRRDDALSAYEKALSLAPDGIRAEIFKNAKRSIESDSKSCS